MILASQIQEKVKQRYNEERVQSGQPAVNNISRQLRIAIEEIVREVNAELKTARYARRSMK